MAEDKAKNEEWSKSYSIKFDLYEDNANDNGHEQKNPQPESPETEPLKNEEKQNEKEWSKSYSMKFDLYEDVIDNIPDHVEEDKNNTENKDEAGDENEPSENDTKIDDENNTRRLTADKGTAKHPKAKLNVSAVFLPYIESQDSKTPSVNSRLSARNLAYSPSTPTGGNAKKLPRSPSRTKSRLKSLRALKFLRNDSDDDGSEDDEWDDDDDDFYDPRFAAQEFQCKECLCYFMFLILFTGMAIFSIGTGDLNYTQTSSIRRSLIDRDYFNGWTGIEKTFNDATTIEDIYHYMRQLLLPFLLSDPVANDGDDLFYVQKRHILMGGIRLRQIRLQPMECEVCANIKLFGQCENINDLFDDKPCYDISAPVNRENVSFYEYGINESIILNQVEYAYIDSSILLDQRMQGKFDSYPGGGYIHDLPLDLNESLEQVNELERVQWIDAATLMVSIDFNLYNPSESLHTVARIFWEMPTSDIVSNEEIKTWKFDRYHGEMAGFILLLIHVTFIMFVFVLTGIEIVDIYRFYTDDKKEGKDNEENQNKTEKKSLWNRWRVLDIFNLLIFYITFALFLHNESYQKRLIDLYDVSPPFQSFRRLAALSAMEAYCFAINGFLLWLKLFKYLGFHPKFQFLFFMVSRGLQDIIMFLIMLFVFYLAFATSGFIIFGGDVEAYRSYPVSLLSMNGFFLTEMPYSEIIASARLYGSAYYYMWLFWMTFVLINVFIAILIDSYSKTQVEIELDGANAIQFKVFEKGREYVKQVQSAILQSRFDAIDRDGDDKVDADEIAKALNVDIEDAQEILEKYDKDGNGILDREEFEKLKQKMIRDLMSKKPKHREIKDHDSLHDQINDMKELMNAMLAIDPAGKRVLKSKRRSLSMNLNNNSINNNNKKGVGLLPSLHEKTSSRYSAHSPSGK